MAHRGRGWASLGALAPALVLAGCGSTSARSTEASRIPRRLLAEARPIGRGPRFQPPANGPVVGQCWRRLGRRYGVHLEVFAANRVVIVPAGIGVRPPIRVSSGRISSAGCYGAVATLEPTGLMLVRSGSRLSVSDLFRSWGQPLSASRLASFAPAKDAQISVFVNGRRWPGTPGSVPLRRHEEIVVEAGPYVPPHPTYTFPPGT